MIVDRLSERAHRLAVTQAISQLNRVDRRLLALFWHLAERWGRVARDGIAVPLALSHRLIGEVVGARRPTRFHRAGRAPGARRAARAAPGRHVAADRRADGVARRRSRRGDPPAPAPDADTGGAGGHRARKARALRRWFAVLQASLAAVRAESEQTPDGLPRAARPDGGAARARARVARRPRLKNPGAGVHHHDRAARGPVPVIAAPSSGSVRTTQVNGRPRRLIASSRRPRARSPAEHRRGAAGASCSTGRPMSRFSRCWPRASSARRPHRSSARLFQIRTTCSSRSTHDDAERRGWRGSPPGTRSTSSSSPRALAQLLVDRLELLVGRLELLVHRLELLVGRLELLVGRLELLVGRLELLVGRLELLDRRLQLLVGGLAARASVALELARASAAVARDVDER